MISRIAQRATLFGNFPIRWKVTTLTLANDSYSELENGLKALNNHTAGYISQPSQRQKYQTNKIEHSINMFGSTGSPFEFKRERSSISEEIIGKIGKLNMENKFDESSLLRDIFNHVKNNTTSYKYWYLVGSRQGHKNDRYLPDSLTVKQCLNRFSFLCHYLSIALHLISFLLLHQIKLNFI